MPSYVQAKWEIKNIDIYVNSPKKIYTEVTLRTWKMSMKLLKNKMREQDFMKVT